MLEWKGDKGKIHDISMWRGKANSENLPMLIWRTWHSVGGPKHNISMWGEFEKSSSVDLQKMLRWKGGKIHNISKWWRANSKKLSSIHMKVMLQWERAKHTTFPCVGIWKNLPMLIVRKREREENTKHLQVRGEISKILQCWSAGNVTMGTGQYT